MCVTLTFFCYMVFQWILYPFWSQSAFVLFPSGKLCFVLFCFPTTVLQMLLKMLISIHFSFFDKNGHFLPEACSSLGRLEHRFFLFFTLPSLAAPFCGLKYSWPANIGGPLDSFSRLGHPNLFSLNIIYKMRTPVVFTANLITTHDLNLYLIAHTWHLYLNV